MRLLIDTNVILDYLLSRENFREQAKQVLDLAQYSGDFEFVSSSAVTDIFYLVKKELKSSFEAQEEIRGLLTFVSILTVTEQDIRAALEGLRGRCTVCGGDVQRRGRYYYAERQGLRASGRSRHDARRVFK